MSTPSADGFKQTSSLNSPVLVIGPSKAGKSVYLSALVLATEKNWKSEYGLNGTAASIEAEKDRGLYSRVAVITKNKAMADLTKSGRQFIDEGIPQFGGSQVHVTYEFDLKLKASSTSSSWFGLQTENRIVTAPFCVIDGPGGTIFPSAARSRGSVDLPADQLEKFRTDLVAHARRSKGILICLDACDHDSAGAFFHDLLDFFSPIGHPLPFERIVFLLTKAEKMVPNRRGADKLLMNLDPRPQLEDLLPVSLNTIFNWKRDTAQVCCGWASAYGFIPNEGSPNFIDTKDKGSKLRSVQPDMTLNDKLRLWMPFRLLDPLMFLATGEQGSLKTVEDKRW